MEQPCFLYDSKQGRSGKNHSICKVDEFDGEFGSHDAECIGSGSVVFCKFANIKELTSANQSNEYGKTRE